MAEYKFGNPAKGKDLFESLIANNPKRADVWNIYLDSELKSSQEPKSIRYIFERAITLNLATKTMKNLFTRYLNFERDFGTAETVEQVRQKALEYVSQDN